MFKVSCILLITLVLISVQSLALPILNLGDVEQFEFTASMVPVKSTIEAVSLIPTNYDEKDLFTPLLTPSKTKRKTLLQYNDVSLEKKTLIKRAAETKTETKEATCPHCKGKGCPSCRDGQTRNRSKSNAHKDTFQQEPTQSNLGSHSSASIHQKDKASSSEKQGGGKSEERA